MKRILVYSHDTFGLGNIRRMLEVARHLVQSSGEVSVLVITGSPMLHAFRIPDRIDYVKLPCLSRNVDGRYGARTLPISLEQTVRLRANLIRSAIADFEPDLILVDKKPFGVEDELAGALEAMSSSAKRPKLVLLLRDILDSAESTTRVWRKNGYFEAISAYYDHVLVVGCPEVCDLRREYDYLRREYEDGGTWWEVQARSTDWIVDFRVRAAERNGLTLTKDEAQDITALDYDIRERILFEQLAAQIVSPTGVTAKALRQMADAGAEGEVRKLMTAMAFVNSKESQSSGIFRADFSQRRSGNRGQPRSSAHSK